VVRGQEGSVPPSVSGPVGRSAADWHVVRVPEPGERGGLRSPHTLLGPCGPKTDRVPGNVAMPTRRAEKKAPDDLGRKYHFLETQYPAPPPKKNTVTKWQPPPSLGPCDGGAEGCAMGS